MRGVGRREAVDQIAPVGLDIAIAANANEVGLCGARSHDELGSGPARSAGVGYMQGWGRVLLPSPAAARSS